MDMRPHHFFQHISQTKCFQLLTCNVSLASASSILTYFTKLHLRYRVPIIYVQTNTKSRLYNIKLLYKDVAREFISLCFKRKPCFGTNGPAQPE